MTAKKFDSGKPQLSMLPPGGLRAVARVLEYGAGKYGRNNWLGGMKHSRLVDAALRHIVAYCEGERVDPESGLCHASHAACNLMFLLHYLERGIGNDDMPGAPAAEAAQELPRDREIPAELPITYNEDVMAYWDALFEDIDKEIAARDACEVSTIKISEEGGKYGT